MSTHVRILADSVAPGCPRLVSYELRYAKFIHGEHLRHRAKSFSVSSGRAVPARKQLEAVRADPAMPAYWGREQKGMSPGAPFTPDEVRRIEALWLLPLDACIAAAEAMADLGVHKSLLGRLLLPWAHYNLVCTCAEPGLLNFFALRCSDKADPTIRRLAVRMALAYRDSTPEDVGPGGYHAPYWTPEERDSAARVKWALTDSAQWDHDFCPEQGIFGPQLWRLLKLSVARTGRVSVEHHGIVDRPEEKDLRFFDDRLRDGDWSVFEHCARAPFPGEDAEGLHGNLPGWVQLRQCLEPNVHKAFDLATLERFRGDWPEGYEAADPAGRVALLAGWPAGREEAR